MSQYQGNEVTILRSAQSGDAGFDASKDQVTIRLANGEQKTVLRSEVK